MNRTLTLMTALGAGLALAPFATAQAPAAAAPAAVTPVAMDAKIALINFEQVVLASNEGQQVTAATQKKYEPKKDEIEKEAKEVESKKAELKPTMTDEARAKALQEIDRLEKKLQRDADDAQTAYNADWQEAAGWCGQEDRCDDEEVLRGLGLHAAAGCFEPVVECDVGRSADRYLAGGGGHLQQAVGYFGSAAAIAAPVGTDSQAGST